MWKSKTINLTSTIQFDKYFFSKKKAMIPSSYIIGTGFLISKDSIDKTRRKSLITRLCNRPIKLEHLLIQFLIISKSYHF
jgi:hypothetical protein